MGRALALVLCAGCQPEAPPSPAPAPEPTVPASTPTAVRPAQPPSRALSAEDVVSLGVLEQGVAETRDYHTRWVATDALGFVPGSERVVSLLEARLGDPEEDVRAAAVLSLGRHGARPAACALLRSVRDDAHELLGVRVLAARALLQNCTSGGQAGP